MTPDVKQVKVLPDFRIEAVFEDGEARRFDLTPYLDYPVFSPLREKVLFARAHIEHGVVVWNDEIDLSPDTLYLRGERIDVQQESV